MELLQPDWNQSKPTSDEVANMCEHISLTPIAFQGDVFGQFLKRMRDTHDNGGAHIASMEIGSDPVFDWFASRNRLWEENVLSRLVMRPEIRECMPEVFLPGVLETGPNFKMESSFSVDGHFADMLYFGGAYSRSVGDGSREKNQSLMVCEAMFGMRFAEVLYYVSCEQWTHWFKGVAWDYTGILFDLRYRRLWTIAVTDTD